MVFQKFLYFSSLDYISLLYITQILFFFVTGNLCEKDLSVTSDNWSHSLRGEKLIKRKWFSVELVHGKDSQLKFSQALKMKLQRDLLNQQCIFRNVQLFFLKKIESRLIHCYVDLR